jgi:hypothetical protein
LGFIYSFVSVEGGDVEASAKETFEASAKETLKRQQRRSWSVSKGDLEAPAEETLKRQLALQGRPCGKKWGLLPGTCGWTGSVLL